MLAMFFSFHGRIGRLRYFLTAMGSSAGLVVIAILGAMSVSRSHPISGLAGLIGLGLVLAIAMVWSGLSLQARRIRDIGWEPTIVIPGVMALHVLLGVAAIMPGHLRVPLSLPLSLVFGLVLLLWPGQGDDEGTRLADIFGDEPDDPQPAPVLPMAARREPAPMRPGAPRKTFGKRGLA